jgi:hypothetical protein
MSTNKGISDFAKNYFVEQNELRRRGEKYTGPKGNTEFRKEVLLKLVDEFKITIPAACTHYNNALKFVRDCTPELVAGLGRPAEKNNGGRKPKARPEAAAQGVTREQVLANMLEALPATISDVQESTMLAGALSPAAQAELEEALM